MYNFCTINNKVLQRSVNESLLCYTATLNIIKQRFVFHVLGVFKISCFDVTRLLLYVCHVNKWMKFVVWNIFFKVVFKCNIYMYRNYRGAEFLKIGAIRPRLFLG